MKTCDICRRFQPEIYICRDQELPGQIAHHLRQQPLIFMKCYKLFLQYLGDSFKIGLSLFLVLRFKFSVSSFLGIFLFLIFLLSIPLVVILLLTFMSLCAICAVLKTCPVNTIFYCNVERDVQHVLLERCSSTLVTSALKFLAFLFSPLTAFAVTVVLTEDAIAIFTILLWATQNLLSEKSLPYIACLILVFYYLWSSYSSFTNKY